MRSTFGLCICTLLIACGSDAEGETTASTFTTTMDPSAGDGDGQGGSESTDTSTTSGSEETSGEETGAGETGETTREDPGCNTRPGFYGDCVNNEWPEICGDNAASCVSDDATNPTFGVCFLSNCFEDCDCWAAPETGTVTPMCSNDVLTGGAPGCFLNCAGGLVCADGMECIASNFCAWNKMDAGDGDGDTTGGDGDGDADALILMQTRD